MQEGKRGVCNDAEKAASAAAPITDLSDVYIFAYGQRTHRIMTIPWDVVTNEETRENWQESTYKKAFLIESGTYKKLRAAAGYAKAGCCGYRKRHKGNLTHSIIVMSTA
ncbi:hypothetical protein V1477_011403 [Vespula maculifrons]|uniref:Uncharacterized protein n=1 Tax=Vespula maculifrons TaxID=7453 RepID=A0ABD2C4T1_VESMC